MDSEPRQLDLYIRALGASVVLGLVGNLLIRDHAWGFGFFVFAVLIFATGIYLHRLSPLKMNPGVKWLAPLGLIFAAMFLWRDAAELKLLNGIGFFAVVGVVALRAHTGNLVNATIFDYPFRIVGRLGELLGDFFKVADLGGQWKVVSQGERSKSFAATARGLLIAVPIVMLFGGLFVNADQGFERLVRNAFTFDPVVIWSNIFVTVACAWGVGGLFGRLFLRPEPPPVEGPPKPEPRPAAIEAGVVLISLIVLFGAFVATQAQYFFGGSNVVRDTAGLALSEYARRGFFELVAVSALSLIVLLAAHELMKPRPKSAKAFVPMALILIALVGLIMASATSRMVLYVDAFGTSQLRVYVFAAMAWLAVVFLYFAYTLVRGQGDKFAFGALASFLLGILCLNFIDPDGLVARVNTSRDPQSVDVRYLGRLSADATPYLISALPSLPPALRQELATSLLHKEQELAHRDSRSWNWSTRVALWELQRLNTSGTGMRVEYDR
jgi:hypothetical protein